LALDEPDAEDKVIAINEILVALDPRIEDHSQQLTLDFKPETGSFVIEGNNSDCC
jgi:hypothetical protein